VTGGFRAFWLLINIYHIREREEWIEKGQPGVTTIQGMGNMQQVHSTGVDTQMSTCRHTRTVSKGEHTDNVHAQQIREKALLIDWWRTLGWQKSSTPTLNSSTKSLVQSSSSSLASMCMASTKHTQAKVECAGLLHAAVSSSALQCLEPFPPAPIV